MKLSPYFIDVRSLIATLGGHIALHKKLLAAGIKTTQKSLYKCSQRQSISGIRLAQIFLIWQQENPISASETVPEGSFKELSFYPFIKNMRTCSSNDRPLEVPHRKKKVTKTE